MPDAINETILRESICEDCEAHHRAEQLIRCHRCGKRVCVTCHAGPEHDQCGDAMADTVIILQAGGNP